VTDEITTFLSGKLIAECYKDSERLLENSAELVRGWSVVGVNLTTCVMVRDGSDGILGEQTADVRQDGGQQDDTVESTHVTVGGHQ